MKPFPNNPRKLTQKRAKQLKETMAEFGDLSGIVHNIDTDEVIGGNQRSNVAALMRQTPTITERFDPPLPDGTAAVGYFDVGGRRFNYRAVTGWSAEKCQRANLIANAGGGAWDSDLLANLDAGLLMASGLDDELLASSRELSAALSAMLASETDYEDAWQGMPEFEQDNKEGIIITVHFLNDDDKKEFLEKTGLRYTNKTKSIWYPERPEELRNQLGTGMVYTDES